MTASIKPRNRGRQYVFTGAKLDLLVEKYNEGLTIDELCEEFDCSRGTICSTIKRLKEAQEDVTNRN